MVAPSNSVHQSYEQNQWNRGSPGEVLPSLETSSTYCQQCRPSSDSGRTGSTSAVECLLQVHKTGQNLEWLGKFPCTLKDSAEDVELVHSSTSRMKTALFLLNLRFDYSVDPPLQHPWIDITREAEEGVPSKARVHPPVLLFTKRDHHPGLPIQRHCP